MTEPLIPHTPGPWVYYGRLAYGHLVQARSGGVAVAYGGSENNAGAVNAVLIAHAPYLLEALQLLLAIMPANAFGSDDPEVRYAWANASAILNKLKREAKDD